MAHKKYRDQLERLLTRMLDCTEPDGTISRYHVTIRCGQWIRAVDIDRLLNSLSPALTIGKRATGGKFWSAREVSEALLRHKERWDREENQQFKAYIEAQVDKGW